MTATVQLRQLELVPGPEAAEALDRCTATLSGCLDELRELARGVLPPVLEARGLAAALRSRARTASVAVRVEATQAVAGRFDPVVESGDLVFTVTDDGPGFVVHHDLTSGSGLRGLKDRIAAVGGVLTVRSAPGAGVVVRGATPVSPVTPVGPEPQAVGS